MYNEQLEQLIDAALTDGVLTEKEKQILFKKAQAMGVDLDEFEMVLDARLVKLQKAEAEKAASSAPKSNKLGDVKKCPACGAIVQSYQGICPECGFAFEGVDANNSSKKLADKIDNIIDEISAKKANGGKRNIFDDSLYFEERNRITNAIINFPIPNTKSDLFEFITSLQSKIHDDDYGDQYSQKLKECILKAKTLFPNDKTFAAIIDSAEKEKKRKEKEKRKSNLSFLFILVGLFIFIGGGATLLYFLDGKESLTRNSVDCNTAVNEALKKDDLDTAEELIYNFRGDPDNVESNSFFHNPTDEERIKANIRNIDISVEKVMDAYMEKGNQKGAKKLYDYYSKYSTPTKQMNAILSSNE